MIRLYLTRHGETQWNLEGRMQGRKDSPLTALGENQARWLGASLHETPLDLIIASASGRAMRTAELIQGTRPIELLPKANLMEIDLGDWEGLTNEEVESRYAMEHRNFWNFPHLYQSAGGESFAQVLSRAGQEIETILADHCGKNILIVTHAVVLKSLLAYFGGKELKDLWSGAFMKPTSLTLLEIDGDQRRFLLQGDVSHYRG